MRRARIPGCFMGYMISVHLTWVLGRLHVTKRILFSRGFYWCPFARHSWPAKLDPDHVADTKPIMRTGKRPFWTDKAGWLCHIRQNFDSPAGSISPGPAALQGGGPACLQVELDSNLAKLVRAPHSPAVGV